MAFDYIPLWDRYEALFEALNEDEVGRLVFAMFAYKNGQEPDISGNERIVWPSIKRDIDQAKASYDATVQKQRENGAKGGRPKKADGFSENPKNPVVFPETQKSKYKAKQSKAIQSNSPDGENTRAKRFTPPTLAEVQSYVAERQSPVDPQGFIDFYESKGWLVGKTPMKDWKAACRNAEKWERWTRPDVQKAKGAVTQANVSSQEYQDRLRKDMAWLEQFSRGEVEA